MRWVNRPAAKCELVLLFCFYSLIDIAHYDIETVKFGIFRHVGNVVYLVVDLVRSASNAGEFWIDSEFVELVEWLVGKIFGVFTLNFNDDDCNNIVFQFHSIRINQSQSHH